MGSRGPLSALPVDMRAAIGHRRPRTTPKAAPIAPAQPRWSALFPLPTLPGPTLAKGEGAGLRRRELAAAQDLVAEVKRARREAAGCWREALTFLDGLGILARGDRDALCEYACARAWQALYARVLAREGGVVRGSGGVLAVHPASRLERSYGAVARALAVQLGLTPLARQRMDVAAPEGDDDKWAGLLDPFD